MLLGELNQVNNRIDENEKNLTRNNIVQNNPSHTFKRHLTSSSQYGDEENVFQSNEQNENEKFSTINKNNRRKQRRTNGYNENKNNDDDIRIIEPNIEPSKKSNKKYGCTFLNRKIRTSNIANNEKSYRSTYQYDRHDSINNNKNNRTTNENEVNISYSNGNNDNENRVRNIIQNKNSNDEHDDSISIFNHALHYAVESHFPPIRIIRQPKVNQNEANNLIKALLAYAEKSFRNLNKNYGHPVGFDYWFVDKSGNTSCYTRHIEFYVFLCESQNYPNNLCNINVRPIKPKHLPSQQSIVLKCVPNYIAQDEIKNELESTIKSFFNIEEMKGSMMEKYRHIRIELNSTDEYKKYST
ncbi:unnamed protein product [Rotaria magnacalcarata]